MARGSKDAPYLKPKERRAHAVAATKELLSNDIDIEAVRYELTTPYPRPEVADRTFLRAQKAISVLLRENGRLRALVEDAVETLEAMDLHIDNPLYERLRSGLEQV